MPGFLLSVLLAIQAIPIQAAQGGILSGVLRDDTGKPVVGVRVAAVAVPQSAADATNVSVMGAIAETDAEGRFRLESVPPGRYYIAAGRLDLPTYYPGTQEMNKGTIVTVAGGDSYSQINFTLQDSSAGRAVGFGSWGGGLIATTSTTIPPMVYLPIELRVEDGEAVPVFGPSGFVEVGFEPTSGGAATDFRLDTSLVRILGPGPVGFRIRVRNLPEGTAVKSMTYDGVELQSGVLQIPAGNFSPPMTGMYISFSGAPPRPQPAALPNISAVNPSQNVPRMGPPLVITLNRSPVAAGTRVRGKLFGPTQRSIYLSGSAGILYSDGTCEFRNVLPGRHSVVSADGGSPLAASIVVGDTDFEGILLQTVAVLPEGIGKPATPAPAGRHAPGTTVPMASIRGKVLDRESREPPARGMAYLRGEASDSAFSLNGIDGTFEFRRLLPGSYTLEITTSEHQSVTRPFVIGDEGIDIEIEAVRTAQP